MIRKATERDIPAVAQIYSDIHTLEEKGLYTTGWLRDIYPTRLTAEKAVMNDELYVLEEDGMILASARLNRNQEPEYAHVNWRYAAENHEVLVMHTLVVSPAVSGKGYGRAFAAYYENMARSMGCKALRIDTNARNLRARRMYANLGYREAGIVPTTFNGIPGVELVCLEKFIGEEHTAEQRVCDLLERIKVCFEQVLGDNLAGIYVHGSLAFGCFTWETGDIDLIAVADSEPSFEQKRSIIQQIMDIESDAPSKGIEFSMLLREDCRNFAHPMPYVMHYSKGHTARYAEDMDGHIRRLCGKDRDLAAHITVMHAVGYPLTGPAVKEMFSEVAAKDYLDALICDIEDAACQIHENPVYVILNLCRVRAFLKDGSVLSKADGGRWGLDHLPEDCALLVRAALEGYAGEKCGRMLKDKDALNGFAAYMLKAITEESDKIIGIGR